jgi:hypothetical protein
VDRTADHYRKKVAEYEREGESATDETMRAYFCMMRDQWLIVEEAFGSTDKNESTTEEHLSNPVHSRAAFQSRNGRRCHHMLMTSSNWLACTTGKSAGFAPMRTRPV